MGRECMKICQLALVARACHFFFAQASLTEMHVGRSLGVLTPSSQKSAAKCETAVPFRFATNSCDIFMRKLLPSPNQETWPYLPPSGSQQDLGRKVSGFSASNVFGGWSVFPQCHWQRMDGDSHGRHWEETRRGWQHCRKAASAGAFEV